MGRKERKMTKDEVIETLSDLRSQYNCFDEKEEPYYMALCIAIKSVRIAENMKKAIPVEWIQQYMEAIHTGDIFTDGIVRIHVENMVDDWLKEQRKEE